MDKNLFLKEKSLIIKKGEAYLSLDNEFKCIYINDWAEKLLDKKKENVLGINYFSVLPEILQSISETQLVDCKKKQSSASFDFYLENSDKWIFSQFVPHYNGADVFLKDITVEKQKANQKELKEKRFVKAFESSPIALLIIDYFDDKVVDVNNSFLNLFEFIRDEIIEKDFFSLNIINNDFINGQTSVCALLKKESIYKYDVSAKTKLNKKLNIILSSETIKINGDKQLLLTFIDLTEKIKFQQLISESEEWFRSIADNSPILIWGTDENMKCNYVNHTWQEFTGYHQADFQWQDIIHENDYKDFISSFDKSYKRKTSFKREFRMKNKHGVFRWMYEFANPIILPDGKFKGFIGSCADIDDKKNENIYLEKIIEERTLELTQSLEIERNLNDAKSRFVSLASHEFRTPLSSILSSVYLIEKYSSELELQAAVPIVESGSRLIEQRKKHIERIKKSITHLTETLNDFLSLDQLEQGKISIKPDYFDLIVFTKEIIDEVKPLLKQGQIIKLNTRENFHVYMDKRILKNVYMNLISNAIKYSSIDKSIEITIEKNSTYVFIEFKDDGIGIPFKEQQFIFNKFYRAENATHIQGTGLGLNIVKKYIDLLGGDITFQSIQGNGTCFILSIPIK